jgi:DNA-binding NtrC family response regulator
MAAAQLLLLVEDETMILNLLQEALMEAGYEVVVARDGARALEELEADADRFRGIITDIRLGSGPDGWEVGHRARELSPHIQVVYMSGDSGHEWASQGVPNSLMVSKPFAVAQVVTAISTLLVQEDTRRGGQPD